jgi:predicted branched-subunit amino acid permease
VQAVAPVRQSLPHRSHGDDGCRMSDPQVLPALRASLSLPGLVLLGSMVGFGGMAHDAGWSLFETLLSTVVIWALPAQVILIGALASGAGLPAALAAVSFSSIRLLPMVCSLLPLLRRPSTGLATQILASHYVAQTVWILSLLNLPRVEREDRLAFYFWMANLTILLSLVGCAIGWFAAGRLPRPLDIALLMLTPISFLLSTEKTAKDFNGKLAFGLGLALTPIVHVVAPLLGLGQWDILIAGLIGGGAAFLAGLSRRQRAAS